MFYAIPLAIISRIKSPGISRGFYGYILDNPKNTTLDSRRHILLFCTVNALDADRDFYPKFNFQVAWGKAKRIKSRCNSDKYPNAIMKGSYILNRPYYSCARLKVIINWYSSVLLYWRNPEDFPLICDLFALYLYCISLFLHC